MTLVGGTVYQSGRSTERKKKGKYKKARPHFEPTEQQIECAAGRIVGMLKSHRGSFYHLASRERLHKELVHSINHRGVQLGRTSEEVSLTLRSALKSLVEQDKIRYEQDSSGREVLILREWKVGKVHKDKYRRPTGLRRIAA